MKKELFSYEYFLKDVFGYVNHMDKISYGLGYTL